ncbi:hypothetical protein HK102_012025 [Quaeritorhiza haematococci]|nr:hypothetical protein HK102_012025 [Quaeritorhiza haematococci]
MSQNFNNIYTNRADLIARQHAFQDYLLQKKAEKLVPQQPLQQSQQTQAHAQGQGGEAVNARVSAAYGAFKKLNVDVGKPLKPAPWPYQPVASQQWQADRWKVFGRASITFIYHLGDPEATKRLQPYLLAAYTVHAVLIGGLAAYYWVWKRPRDEEEDGRGRYRVEELVGKES